MPRLLIRSFTDAWRIRRTWSWQRRRALENEIEGLRQARKGLRSLVQTGPDSRAAFQTFIMDFGCFDCSSKYRTELADVSLVAHAKVMNQAMVEQERGTGQIPATR
jgi:hypothetical protein